MNNEWLLIVVFYLLLLQNALELYIPVLKYTDELIPLIGIVVMARQAIRSGKLRLKQADALMVLMFFLFLLSGLLGNWIYRYQPTTAVLTDLYTNMKFFLSALTGYVLFQGCNTERTQTALAAHARFMSALFFMLLVLDQLFHIFTMYTETRYGLRVTALMYQHPTYLAGAAAFLLTVLTAFYRKRNNVYIMMCLVLMCFTLRGKAIASALLYCVIFFFIMVYRKKLRMWHIAVIVLAALAIAGEQLSYYYIENRDSSARAVLTSTSITIMDDYFPIGTGFGTYASSAAANPYSPVYQQYELYNIYGLSASNPSFSSDTFWPIIFGQTGVLGTFGYLAVMARLFYKITRSRKTDIRGYATGIFAFGYILISSTSETAFNNSIAVPLATMIGYVLTLENKAVKI